MVNVRAPAVVQDLTATSGDQRVRLNWRPGEDPDLVGYQVLRAMTEEGPYELVGAVGAGETPWFEDLGEDGDGDGAPDGLTNGLRHFYKVVGLDKEGLEGHLHLASVADAVPQIPAGSVRDLEVTGLRALAQEDRVLLTWDPVDNSDVLGFRVYREVLAEAGVLVERGVVPRERTYFFDTGVTPGEDYAYEVVPVSRELREGVARTCDESTDAPGLFPDCRVGVEGRRQRSRVLTPLVADLTLPLAPGHAPELGAVEVAAQGGSGVTLAWGRPIQNTDGSFFQTEGADDDLIGGGFVIYRSKAARGPFEPLDLLEVVGSETSFTYTDPRGGVGDVYQVRAYDRFGGLGDPSRVVSPGIESMPDLVQNLDAFASANGDSIVVTWDPEPLAVGGYRVLRSTRLSGGFTLLAELPPEVTALTDPVAAEDFGTTFYYRVAPLFPDLDGVEVAGAPSPPAAAVAGPTDGVFFVQFEDAQVRQVGGVAGDLGEAVREGAPAPFSGKARLRLSFTDQAQVGATQVEFLWNTEVASDGTAADPSSPLADPNQTFLYQSYDAYLRVVRDERAPRVDLALEVRNSANPFQARLGVNALELAGQEFGSPRRTTMVPLGALVFEDQNKGTGTSIPEPLAMTLTFQGADSRLAGDPTLLLDALVLVRR